MGIVQKDGTDESESELYDLTKEDWNHDKVE
jgi:hypothetical protein